jgi:acylphosphatase
MRLSFLQNYLSKHANAMGQKEAATYRVDGDAVQGVGLRKTYHQLLDDENMQGLAVNDPYTNSVELSIEGQANKRKKVLTALAAYIQLKTGKDIKLTPIDKDKKLHKVSLSSSDIDKLNALHHLNFVRSDKFLQYPENERELNSFDNALNDYMARYRLQREDKGLQGFVTERALRQLRGEELPYNWMLPENAVRSVEEAIPLVSKKTKQVYVDQGLLPT